MKEEKGRERHRLENIAKDRKERERPGERRRRKKKRSKREDNRSMR